MTAFDRAWDIVKMPIYHHGDDAPKEWGEGLGSELSYGDFGTLDDLTPVDSMPRSFTWRSKDDTARALITGDKSVHADEIGENPITATIELFGLKDKMRGQGLGREKLLEMLSELKLKYPNLELPNVDMPSDKSRGFWDKMENEGHIWVGDYE